MHGTLPEIVSCFPHGYLNVAFAIELKNTIEQGLSALPVQHRDVKIAMLIEQLQCFQVQLFW
jgi:hypothetical protein